MPKIYHPLSAIQARLWATKKFAKLEKQNKVANVVEAPNLNQFKEFYEEGFPDRESFFI
jgi:hypothetical protein